MFTDDPSDRTQPPTERRRREARARGEVARSADLVAALVLLGAMAGLWWQGPVLADKLARLVREGLSAAPPHDVTIDGAVHLFAAVAHRVMLATAPILLVVVAAAAVANLMQTGWLWVPQALLPRTERLDPARGLSRWMSLNSWFGLGSGLAKLVVLTAVFMAFVRVRMASSGPLALGEPSILLSLPARWLGELGLFLSLSLVGLAVLDYGFQFWRDERSLMVTVEERRREQREDEGDPKLKRQRRDLATSRSNSPQRQPVDGIRPV